MRVDLRLAVPAAACWVVCGVLIGFPRQAGWCAAALWVAAAAVLGVVVRRSRARRFWSVTCVALAAAALAATTVAVLSPAHRPADVVEATGGGRAVEAIVRVDSAPQEARATGNFGAASASERFRGVLTSVRSGQTAFAVSAPVLVFVPKAEAGTRSQRVEIGDSVRVRGTLKALAPEDSTSFLVFGSGAPTVVADAPFWLGWANDLRSGFSRAATSLPGDGGTLLPGLSIGDVSAVGPDLDAAMKASSLTRF
jgi:competence protein ComEC